MVTPGLWLRSSRPPAQQRLAVPPVHRVVLIASIPTNGTTAGQEAQQADQQAEQQAERLNRSRASFEDTYVCGIDADGLNCLNLASELLL